MIFPWHASTTPPATTPTIGAEVRRLFAAVAPAGSLLPNTPPKSPHPPSGTSLPIAFPGETTTHIAELRIRQWLLQQEQEARRIRDRRLYPSFPPGK